MTGLWAWLILAAGVWLGAVPVAVVVAMQDRRRSARLAAEVEAYLAGVEAVMGRAAVPKVRYHRRWEPQRPAIAPSPEQRALAQEWLAKMRAQLKDGDGDSYTDLP